MATLYLKTAGGNFNAAATWSNVNASGADNSGPPTAADNCIAELLSGNVTIDSGSVCRSFDTTSGTGSYGGTITHTAAITWAIGDGTAGAGNVAFKLNSGVTYTLPATSCILSFVSTSATTQTITSAGKSMPRLTFNGVGATWQLQDNITMIGTVWTWTAGTVDTNSKTITMQATTSVFNGGAQTYFELDLTGSGTATVNGANTFTNLNRTGTASRIDILSLAASQTITGTLTLNGNSAINRILVQSSAPGTAITLTSAANSISYADFMDITGAGAGSWNLAAITGLSGDCGGNSGITFTSPVTQYWKTTTTGAKSWQTVVNWFLATNGGGGAGRIPLPQDDAIFDANSIGAASTTIQTDMFRLGANINFTGVTNSPTTVTTGLANTIYGSLTLVSAMTWTGTNGMTFAGRGSFTITNAGRTFTQVVSITAPSGTYTLQDALTTNLSFSLNNGTFNANGFNITALTFSSSNANTRAITFGSGTWSITGNSATIWLMDILTNLTIVRGNPVQLTYAGATGTRTISNGLTTPTEANSIDFAIVAGTDTFVINDTRMIHNLDFTGFAGTWTISTSRLTCYGSLTLATGMSITGGTGLITFAGTTGPYTLTGNGVTLDCPVTFNGVGATWQFGDNFTIGSTRTVTLTNGTIALNGKTFTSGTFSTTNSNVRAISGTGTIALTGTGTAWTSATSTNLTISSTSTLKFTDTSNTAITFSGGGATFGTVWWSRGASTASNTIAGSNTFADFKDDGTAAHSILFTAATTQTVAIFHVTGNGAGNEITLNSTTTGTYSLTKTGGGVVSCDYLNIQHCIARPWSGASGIDTFYAGNNSINNQATVTAGNGWIFTPPATSGNFFSFFGG